MSIPAQARQTATRAAARGLERLRAPRLWVVTPPPVRRSRMPFVVGCIALLAGSLIGLLVLNISLSRGAYRVHDLQAKAALLDEQEQALGERLAYRAAPAQLSVQARELGMVPSGAPAFLRLSDGALLGSPQPAPDSPPPAVVVGLPSRTFGDGAAAVGDSSSTSSATSTSTRSGQDAAGDRQPSSTQPSSTQPSSTGSADEQRRTPSTSTEASSSGASGGSSSDGQPGDTTSREGASGDRSSGDRSSRGTTAHDGSSPDGTSGERASRQSGQAPAPPTGDGAVPVP